MRALRTVLVGPDDAQADVLPDVVMPPCCFGRRLAGGPFFPVGRGAPGSLAPPQDSYLPRHFLDREYLSLEFASERGNLDSLCRAAHERAAEDGTGLGLQNDPVAPPHAGRWGDDQQI